jgi:hypothetical protein
MAQHTYGEDDAVDDDDRQKPKPTRKIAASPPIARAKPKPAAPSHSYGDDDAIEDREITKPRRKIQAEAIDDDDDDNDRDSPIERKPKKKKKRRPRLGDEDDDKYGNKNWWILPLVLIIVGLILSFVGTIGITLGAKKTSEQFGVIAILIITFLQFLFSIPISILALFVGGKLLGIEYGTPLQAVAGIAAIGSMMMGLDWFLTWLGLWGTAVHVITFIAGFSLFMTLFQLDSWEVWASIICIKVLTVVAYVAVIVFALGAMNAASKKGNDGPPNIGNMQGDDGDDPDDDVPKKRRR